MRAFSSRIPFRSALLLSILVSSNSFGYCPYGAEDTGNVDGCNDTFTLPSITVIGTPISPVVPMPDNFFWYSPGPGIDPGPISVSKDDEEKKEEDRESCITNAQEIGQKCEHVYGVTWRALCMGTGAFAGRFGYLRVPAFAQFSYTTGVAGSVGIGCSELTNSATQWCQQQTENKIERECK